METIEALRDALARQCARARRPHGSGSQPLGVHARRDGGGARRCARRRHRVRPRAGSTCDGTRASIRGSARRTSCPSSPSGPSSSTAAKRAALALADRVGGELGLPVFLYGELAPGVRPALLRRGGPAELQRRIDAGELTPDRGPARLDPRAGCVLVGARRPLIAFNVNLATDELAVAQSIAAVVRETGGGFSGVRALGFPLASRRLVQVSMNVEELAGVAARGDRGAYRGGGCSAWRRGCRLRARRPHAGGRRPSRGGGPPAREPGRLATPRATPV